MQLMEANGWGLDDLKLKPAQRELHKACGVYIKKIAPDVLEWRNKIAAHRAATDPRADSLALLTYSTSLRLATKVPITSLVISDLTWRWQLCRLPGVVANAEVRGTGSTILAGSGTHKARLVKQEQYFASRRS